MTRSVLALPVADLDSSLAFYLDRLQFKPAMHTPDADIAELIDPDGDQLLLAGPRAGDLAAYLGEGQRILPPGATISFRLDDLAALHDRLLDQGADVAPIAETPWGDRSLSVRDPDGFELRFIAPVERSPEELLAIYAATPEQLTGLLADLGDADLDLSLTPGSWTIRQIVYHLADGDSLFLRGVRMALAEPGRSFSHNWPGSNEPYIDPIRHGQPIEPAVALFRTMRVYLQQLILSTPDPWERAIHDTDGGVWSVRRFVDLMVRHGLEHLAEIRAIRAAHGR